MLSESEKEYRIQWITKVLKDLKKNGISQKDFGEELNLSKSHVSNFKSGATTVSDSVIDKISNVYGVSYGFNELNEPKVKYHIDQASKDTSFIELPNGKFLMLIPLVDQYAQAGYLSGYNDAEYIEELPKVPMIVDRMHKGVYRSFQVVGDSMDDNSPQSIQNGDTVVAREVSRNYWHNRFHLHNWKEYIIVHKDGILVKEIIKHDHKKGEITLHSYNDAPEYEDFTESLENVLQIFNIISVHKDRK